MDAFNGAGKKREGLRMPRQAESGGILDFLDLDCVRFEFSEYAAQVAGIRSTQRGRACVSGRIHEIGRGVQTVSISPTSNRRGSLTPVSRLSGLPLQAEA